jgi:hypothetical protein
MKELLVDTKKRFYYRGFVVTNSTAKFLQVGQFFVFSQCLNGTVFD